MRVIRAVRDIKGSEGHGAIRDSRAMRDIRAVRDIRALRDMGLLGTPGP